VTTPGRPVAPYGTWSSPISAEMLATGAVGLGEPWLDDGVAYWIERRPTEGGRSVLVRADPFSAPADVVPEGVDVRTRAHGYGGGAYTVSHGTVVFSHDADRRLYRLDGGAEPVPITPEVDGRHRFADGRINADGTSWIGVRERHGSDRNVDVVNELVHVPLDGSSEPRIVAGGRDFYAGPRIGPDGTELAFLAWDLPAMPWDGCELFVATLGADGTFGDPRPVAGRNGEESIWQPTWSPRGDLVFASDRSGWWNLERIRDGERRVLHAADAEFGYPQWAFDERSFAFLGDGSIVCWYERDGVSHLAILDPETGELLDLDVPHDALEWGPGVDADGTTILFIAGAAKIPNEVVWLDVAARSVDVLRTSAEVPVDPTYLAEPRAITFPTTGGAEAHALWYEPTNPDVVPPDDERPPLIVMSHGGPTSATTPIFALPLQYWTSRGFAVVDVNYGGSTGYGRAYRERLNGNWGVVDLEDCVAAARYLVELGGADPERLLIRGGSAGGYTTICALTFTEVFAGGASYYGIADLEPFATGDGHKFESRYEDSLVGPYPEEAERYRERSPIHAVDRLSTPMLVLQGSEDDVVPPSQAERIVEALRSRGIPHAYLVFEGEGHGFRAAGSIVRAREAELSFYAQILGFGPGDPVPKLPIAHLP
jgi:dipeptidyl aminopeptidase/acylaminoacyl peptidase